MSIATFDIQTVIALLFWSNLISLVLVYIYLYTHSPLASERKLINSVILAKGFFSVGFLLLCLRGTIPLLISLNLSNSLIIVGCLAEARSMLMIIHRDSQKNFNILITIMTISIILMNAAAFFKRDTILFIGVGLLSLFSMLLLPSCKLIYFGKESPFKRMVGVIYLFFGILLLPGAIDIFSTPNSNIFSHTFIQALSYTALMLLVVFSLSAFLLLMREDSDNKIRKLAQSDSLTGIHNRQHFFTVATPALERHRREHTPCSVIFMDIDHFKKVNDTYGHAFGDAVIVATAEILSGNVRQYDYPCRYGGEEFAAFIDSHDPTIGRLTAERIRSAVEARTFPERPDFKYTISIGVATCIPDDRDSIDSIIKAADTALYEAKSRGRNRVVERVLN